MIDWGKGLSADHEVGDRLDRSAEVLGQALAQSPNALQDDVQAASDSVLTVLA